MCCGSCYIPYTLYCTFFVFVKFYSIPFFIFKYSYKLWQFGICQFLFVLCCSFLKILSSDLLQAYLFHILIDWYVTYTTLPFSAGLSSTPLSCSFIMSTAIVRRGLELFREDVKEGNVTREYCVVTDFCKRLPYILHHTGTTP